MIRALFLILLLALPWAAPRAAESPGFTVEELRVVGLRRISDGTLYNYLPIQVGDTVDAQRVAESLRALFATGFFNDVELRRDGGTLVVVVEERPGIRAFSFSGNSDIDDEDLSNLLRSLGVAEGRILDRSVLQTIEREFTNQYYSRGKYGVEIEVAVEEVGDNQVEVTIEIEEGQRARIRDINIVGNRIFSDEELMEVMELSEPNWLSFYRNDDRYASETLVSDLEELRSHYMDRGFANFQLLSTQVTLSHDRKDVYITVHIDEGRPYTISNISVAGDTVVPADELESLVLALPGSIFNQRLLLMSSEFMTSRLGLDGYAFARADPIPEFDHENSTVAITYLVQPGRRVYVRRIDFVGSTSTEDEVFRREMRQMEGAWISSSAVERSKLRLQRLPFVEAVEVETNPVPGSPDQVDVSFAIQERAPGNFNFGLGFSGSQGLILNAGVTHSNFLGRGERVSTQIVSSDFNRVFSVSHTNPYANVHGVSRSFTVFYRTSDSLVSNGSNFSQNIVGGQLQYGYPINEYSTITFGFGFRNAELLSSANSSAQIFEYVNTEGNPFDEQVRNLAGQVFTTRAGTEFNSLEFIGGWTRDTRNRAIFADRGSRQSLTLEFTGPLSGVQYYTARYNYLQYFPINDDWSLAWNVDLGYGQAYGDSELLPPYKNYLAGGPGSVRGFRESWLGPLDSNGRPYGGNVLVASQLELLLPVPESMRDSTRFAIFLDVGNTFYDGREGFFYDPSTGVPIDYSFSLDELRQSVGIAATWLAPLGAMKFSYALPLNEFAGDGIRPADDLERFQFTISNVF